MLNDIYHSIDRVVFSIGPFTVQWYGLSYIVSFFLAALLVMHVSKLWKIEVTWDAMLTLLISCMLGAMIGGRLGFVLFYGKGYYFQHPDQILATYKGGMSFHGGLIGVAVGLVVASRLLKVPLLTLGDLSAIGATIGLGLVRVANFINGELWGSVTDLPWGVIFDNAGPLPRHPSQLYEAFLEGVVLLLILYLLARRNPPLPRGSYFSVFLIGYGVFRIAVEFIRQPDSQLGYLLGTGWVTMGMLLSLPMVITGIVLLRISLQRNAEQVGLMWPDERAALAAHAGATGENGEKDEVSRPRRARQAGETDRPRRAQQEVDEADRPRRARHSRVSDDVEATPNLENSEADQPAAADPEEPAELTKASHFSTSITVDEGVFADET